MRWLIQSYILASDGKGICSKLWYAFDRNVALFEMSNHLPL